jgi:hypothetical protein
LGRLSGCLPIVQWESEAANPKFPEHLVIARVGLDPETRKMPRKRSRERRRLAARYLALANQTVDPKVRLFLIEMAQRWFDLAGA